MNGFNPIWLIVPVVMIAVIALVFGSKLAQQRRDALAALAGRLGWWFDPEKDKTHDERFAQFAIFRKGHSRNAYNTLTGDITIGGRVFRGQMGDFTYKITSSTGKTTTTTTYRFSYLILHPPFAVVPELRIRPENLFDKLAGAIGFDDIDFE